MYSRTRMTASRYPRCVNDARSSRRGSHQAPSMGKEGAGPPRTGGDMLEARLEPDPTTEVRLKPDTTIAYTAAARSAARLDRAMGEVSGIPMKISHARD